MTNTLGASLCKHIKLNSTTLTSDPLYFFNDESFHLTCLKEHHLTTTAIKYANLFTEKVKPANRKCLLKDNVIMNPQDHIFIEYLTSAESNFLHGFNFTHLDRQNLLSWKEKERLVIELKNLKASNDWQEADKNDYLGRLIVQLS